MATKAQPHFLSSKRVIVAGAGLSGLSFALALRKLWDADIHGPAPLVLVVERDAAPHSRGPVSTGSSTTNYNDGNDNGSDKAAGNLGRDGYSLSLSGFNRDGGLVALRDLGLLEDVLSRAVLVSSTGNDGGPGERPGAGAFKIWTADWAELLSLAPKPYQGLPTGTIRIARRELRRTMLDAAVDAAGAGESVNGAKARPSISLRWATVCIGAEKGDPGPDGMSTVQVRVCPAETYQSTGADGDTQQATTTIEADFLIVADGSRSKLRASLRPHDAALRYTGALQAGGTATFAVGSIPPPVDKNWGLMLSGGRWTGAGTGVTCFFSPVDSHRALWALSWLEPETTALERAAKLKDSTGEGEIFNEFIAEALSRGKGLAEPFGALVRGTDPASITYLPARDKLPFRHVGDRRGKSKSEGDVAGLDLPVVFLGDANHAVSPFAGNGANLALKDGWDLAECLLQQPCRGGADAGRLSLEDSIRSYDARAYPRAVKTLEASRWRIKMAHSTGLRLLLFKVGLGIGGLILQALSKFM